MPERLAEIVLRDGHKNIQVSKSGPKEPYVVTVANGTEVVKISLTPRELWALGSALASIGHSELLEGEEKLKYISMPPVVPDEGTVRAKQVKAKLEQRAADRGLSMEQIDRQIARTKVKDASMRLGTRAMTREEFLTDLEKEDDVEIEEPDDGDIEEVKEPETETEPLQFMEPATVSIEKTPTSTEPVQGA